jgi:DNA-binding XRE family transcriptional regulator
MLDSFGMALRVMRDAAGLTQEAVASRANISKPHYGRFETGARLPIPEVADAIDHALSGGGVLVELAALERGGDDMRRRALLSTIGAAVAVSTLDGPHALGDMIRHGLLNAAGADEDWDAVVGDATTRLVTDPSPMFGAALLTNLMMLRQQVAEKPSTSAFRAAAGLGQVYGLWLGNQAELGGAHHWYRSAGTLADRSGDIDMQAYVRGRSASRGIYEGWTIKQTLDTAAAAEALTERPTIGALEAHAARVSVHALSGNAAAGRAAVASMGDITERLPDEALDQAVAPVERTVFLGAFLECRVGSLDDAERACEAAETTLAGLPTWLAETRVYRGRAMVAAGNVGEGLTYTLDTVQTLRHDVRVIGVAVRDVCSVVPAGHRSDEYTALRAYADPMPGPWETLR